MTVRPRRIWRVRLSLGLTRWILYAVAAFGVAAVAHNAVDPPLRRTVVVTTRPLADTGQRWFALAFARAYFTWSGDSTAHQRALAQRVRHDHRHRALVQAPVRAQRAVEGAEVVGPARAS